MGSLLRRNRWIDQFEWRVHPNQSVMFIGPSGIGKDTIINRCQSAVETLEWVTRVPVLGGVTMEGLYARLALLPRPAAAFIPAPEMTAFFGKADYQANMLTGMTNLLSNGKKVDITTKGMLINRGEQFIHEPTLTMFAGSTVEWLHKGMPDGTLEGGFLGRFLIVVEELGGRMVPLVKSGRTREELDTLREALGDWELGLEALVKECFHPREMILTDEAEHLYSNWYYNRFRLFSKAVIPYANRARDMVLRLGMLMALSRGHTRLVEEGDIDFGVKMLAEVAKRIDAVVLPPTPEAQIAARILTLLPADRSQLYLILGTRFKVMDIENALKLLMGMERITTRGKLFISNGGEM